MFAVVGFTRFPIFYSSNGKRILGSKSPNKDFNDYVHGLDDRPFVALRTLSNLNLKSRFVINNRAINPTLRMRELVPKFEFVYPDDEPDEVLNNVYSRGIVVKGARTPVFIPLISLRILTQDEVDALLKVARVHELDLEGMFSFLNDLDINLVDKELRISGEIVLTLFDKSIDELYHVMINQDGKVLDVDFCFEYSDLYLPELVMLVRENGSVYHIGGFD